MASFTRRGRSWRAAIKIGATRRTETFATRAAAVQWAAQAELEARAIATNAAGTGRAFAPKTLADLLTRYSEEVSEHKAGRRWEQLRLGLMCRDPVALIKLEDLTSADLANWRDRRMGRIVRDDYARDPVGAGAVRREMNLLSHALNVAATEWKWLPESPMKGVRRPPAPPARDRRVHADELERILHAAGYRIGDLSRTVQARVGAAFLFAIETGMRQAEIARLRWEDVELEVGVAQVKRGKTIAARREVPMTPRAIELIRELEPLRAAAAAAVAAGGEAPPIFALTERQIESNFRAICKVALVRALTFHDSRHEAITRLAKRLQILDLARAVGHRDLRQLQVYYNESAANIAALLASPQPSPERITP